MSSTLTNINCEMMSMAVYSALFAMIIQFTEDSNESSSNTDIWEFRKSAGRRPLGAMTSEQ